MLNKKRVLKKSNAEKPKVEENQDENSESESNNSKENIKQSNVKLLVDNSEKIIAYNKIKKEKINKWLDVKITRIIF